MKAIRILMAVAHLLLIFIVCIAGTIKTYYRYNRGVDKANSIPPCLEKINSALYNNPLPGQYLYASGIENGYGFFAPNVASGYILEYRTYSSTGQQLNSGIYPARFTSSESYNRYATFLGVFQQKLLEITNKKDGDTYSISKAANGGVNYLDILMKVAGRKFSTNFKNLDADSVEVVLYLYDYPKYEEVINGSARRASLIELRKIKTAIK